MDSSNSGSFQSSSGGAGGGGADNEEYDSRTQSISSFLNPSTHFNPNLNHLLRPPPSSSHHHHHHPTTDHTALFDPSTTPSFPHSSNPNRNSNPLHDLDSVWTRDIRPDPNLADFGSTRTQTTFDTYPINPTNSSRMDTNTKTGRGSDQHHHQVGATIKNPKKRTRASRRAPTTVLTTDTTNFRQMVQEFTGIPTAPFTAASSPFSRRLDLFGRAGDGGTASLYPLRPSAQKIQQQQPSFLNSMANIIESGTSNNITNATTSSNYELPPSDIHEFQKQPSTLLDLQNPMLSFQSLLQTTLPQQSSHLSGFPSSSKRWRGQDEKVDSFEGVIGNTQNIGGSKLNSGLENVVVSSRSGGDQAQGNEDSWICPSN
ncbi:uncharacterized protein LOC112510320 [Cynara cardunculus var. scolymus]|uniref:uncharacterized protein LOC112510320 n=1 Tax=Cynara cardunculus var. scolymus TaxID=59895 RepID=UPI000D6257B0|nr:uncharacterized protein LOC112510320 [Cynara cardunculus var. scolymus]